MSGGGLRKMAKRVLFAELIFFTKSASRVGKMWHAFVCTSIPGTEAANCKALCMVRTMQHLPALQSSPTDEAIEACK